MILKHSRFNNFLSIVLILCFMSSSFSGCVEFNGKESSVADSQQFSGRQVAGGVLSASAGVYFAWRLWKEYSAKNVREVSGKKTQIQKKTSNFKCFLKKHCIDFAAAAVGCCGVALAYGSRIQADSSICDKWPDRTNGKIITLRKVSNDSELIEKSLNKLDDGDSCQYLFGKRGEMNRSLVRGWLLQKTLMFDKDNASYFIFDNACGELIGMISTRALDQRGNLSLFINKEYRGNGRAMESVLLFLKLCFEVNPDCRQLIWQAGTWNKASSKLALKVGFKHVEQVDVKDDFGLTSENYAIGKETVDLIFSLYEEKDLIESSLCSGKHLRFFKELGEENIKTCGFKFEEEHSCF
jgi:RimJ/RimL family protein N-acetyltransferase